MNVNSQITKTKSLQGLRNANNHFLTGKQNKVIKTVEEDRY